MRSDANENMGIVDLESATRDSFGRKAFDFFLGFSWRRCSANNLPAIEGWKTSALLSLAGLLVSWALCVALVSFFGWAVAPVIKMALVLIYSLVIYPSFFRQSPFMQSSKMISFANFAFSGFIFGPRWNSNLTDSKEAGEIIIGRSYMIAPVLYVALYILLFLGGITNMLTLEMALYLEATCVDGGNGGFIFAYLAQCLLLAL